MNPIQNFKQNDALKTQLEDETLLRSELQNKVDDLLEDLRMEQRNHQNELDEVYRKREIEMNTIGEQLQTDYNKELQNQVQQLRAESDARIRQSRQDVEDKFSDKMKVSVDCGYNPLLVLGSSRISRLPP